jgi:hypothetical protein
MAKTIKTGRDIRISDLRTAGGIMSEMGRVYREMRTEKIETSEGMRLMQGLYLMKQTYDSVIVEERITALEERRQEPKPMLLTLGNTPDGIVSSSATGTTRSRRRQVFSEEGGLGCLAPEFR